MDAGRNRPSKSPPLGTEFAALTALMVHRNQPATGHVRRLRRRAARHSLTGGDAIVAGKGDVVWAADRPTLSLPDGTSRALRATVVASRVEGSMVIE
jgi:hypothetical protein